MGKILEEDIERVRAQSDLLALVRERTEVKRSGHRYKACCPFHSEKTPSFYVDPDTGLWHCFGCGEGGDVFKYVMMLENMDFPDSVRYLAQRAHIELHEGDEAPQRPKGYKERLYECMRESASYYHMNLMRSSDEGAAQARAYLGGRRLGSEVCKRWNLGYSPGHESLVRHLAAKGFTQQEMIAANLATQGSKGRLRDRFFERAMFPIQDRFGKTIAFGGRIIGSGQPKYLNTGDTPLFTKSRNLYGIERAKDAITASGQAIVCEGYTDVIALHEAGFVNSVATLGTALTAYHLRTLKSLRPKSIVYLFDGDNAGQKAADRAIEFIDSAITPESGGDHVAFEVVVLPQGKDPAEYISDFGADALKRELAACVPLLRFAIDRSLEGWDLSDPVQRNGAVRSAVSILSPVKGSIIASDYSNYIADRLGCDSHVVLSALRRAQPRKPRKPATEEDKGNAACASSGRPEGAWEKAARECLSLAVRSEKLVRQVCKLGPQVGWPDLMSQGIADALEKCAGLAGPQLLGRLEQLVPGAGAYLGASRLDFDDEQSLDLSFKQLFLQVREHDIQNRIRSANNKMKYSENISEDEYDALFRNVSALQKELQRLRNCQQL